ncbi:unnamed protein product [marine sediment metagenome]|uniref:Lipoprotein n=1 Tax=marine sediment metagenome TaxID=412755 RepID=X0TE14_9ZZZZ
MKNFIFLISLFLIGCATGKNAKNQTNPQLGYTASGNIENISTQRDMVKGNNITINNFSADSYDKEQVKQILEENIRLKKEINKLSEEIKQTVFVLKESNVEKLDNGNFELTFILSPKGNKIIQIFSIQVEAKEGTQIENFDVKGNTLPNYYEGTANKGTIVARTYKTMMPSEISVKMITTKNPNKYLVINLMPFEK